MLSTYSAKSFLFKCLVTAVVVQKLDSRRLLDHQIDYIIAGSILAYLRQVARSLASDESRLWLMSLELTVGNRLDFMLRPMLIQVVLYLGSLRTLQVLLAPMIRRVVAEEIPLTMGVADGIHPWLTTRVASVFLILSSSRTRSTIISATSIFQIE